MEFASKMDIDLNKLFRECGGTGVAISGDNNVSGNQTIAVGADSLSIDPEIKRVLLASISLGSTAEIKKILQDFITQKIGENK
ncbi:MAG: hypothetical protein LBU73_00145 [Helicobacteraceae bacterium]|nr:hypothetical protein [Helicobacteraceae bacterium]